MPGAPQAVTERELQLGSVERALSGLVAPGEAGAARRVGEQRLGPVPDGVVAEAVRWTAREGDLEVLEAERRVQRPQAPDEAKELVRDLFLAAEDVPVVLGELAQAEQTVEGSRGLVAVDEAELGDAERKLAPQRTQAANQLHVPGTADRLQRPGLALDDQHPLAEDAPVAAALPDWLGEDLGAPHLAVALAEDDAPEVVLEGAEQLEPAWVPGTRSGGLLLEVEQPQAVAEGAMIVVVQHARTPVTRPGVTGGTMEGLEARAPRRNHGRDGEGVLERFRPPTHTRRSDPPRGWWSWWCWRRDVSRRER